MILVKGTRVVFDLKDGRSIHAPARAGMLHDPDGSDWKRCSVLVGPFARTREAIEDKKATHYFGRNYQARACRISLPPKPLSDGWKPIGPLERIWYTRPGTKYPGPFQHKFKRGWLRAIFGLKKRAIVYRRSGWYRIEMPDGCTLDDRGFVSP